MTVFDGGLSERRRKLLPSYKDREIKNRSYPGKADPDEFLESYKEQRDILIELVKKFGIPCVHMEGWEGDDLLYALSKITKDVIIMTDDQDFYQLVSENVKIARPIADEVVTLESLKEKGYTPVLHLIEKCIYGDPSDNIPNVTKGLGKVNSNRLAKIVYNNPNNYLDIIAESEKKVDQEFVKNHENFIRNQQLINLKEVDNDLDDEILGIIEREIYTVLGKSDYFKATIFLGQHEVKGIDVDSMMLRLSSAKKHIIDN